MKLTQNRIIIALIKLLPRLFFTQPATQCLYVGVCLHFRTTEKTEDGRLRERLLLRRRKMLRGTTSGIVVVLDAFAQKALTEELLELGTGLSSGGGDDGGGNGGGGTM